MGINFDAVGAVGDPATFSWTARDCMLYALGVGAGADDPGSELDFTAREGALRVLPTFVVLANQHAPKPDALGAPDRSQVLHAGQEIELFAPIPASGNVVVQSRIADIFDKGTGTLIVTEIEGRSAENEDAHIFKTRSSTFVRGTGGWGGPRGPSLRWQPPSRSPDAVVRYQTRRDQALLYRLSGDYNPLHSEPEVARKAGFERPILHGLCTFGFAGRALLGAFCASEPESLRSMTARFSKPVLPGTLLTVNVWADGDEAVFSVLNDDGSTVLDSGVCRRQSSSGMEVGMAIEKGISE